MEDLIIKTIEKNNKKELPTTICAWENPVPFDQNFKWNHRITFTADSYTKWLKDTLPIVDTLTPISRDDVAFRKKVSECGITIGGKILYLLSMPMWDYQARFVFTEPRLARVGLSIYRGSTEGTIYFDGAVAIPVLADSSSFTPWMSLTPNEILTLRGSIRRAKNDTAIAGLGLGWVARKILERKQVKKLTIYEKCDKIAEYFGRPLIEDFGDRVSIICCDAYTTDWMKHDVGLWDIWSSYGDASDDRKYLAIRDEMRSVGKVCIGWGEGIS